MAYLGEGSDICGNCGAGMNLEERPHGTYLWCENCGNDEFQPCFDGVSRKSVREVVAMPQSNEYYVLVSRYVPPFIRYRGLKIKDCFDVWDRGLAPSADLLKAHKLHRDWGRYTTEFFFEHPVSDIKEKVAIHLQNAHEKSVVLVCQEEHTEYPHCHSWLILDALKTEEAG